MTETNIPMNGAKNINKKIGITLLNFTISCVVSLEKDIFKVSKKEMSV